MYYYKVVLQAMFLFLLKQKKTAIFLGYSNAAVSPVLKGVATT
jgi:hypothetical protein